MPTIAHLPTRTLAPAHAEKPIEIEGLNECSIQAPILDLQSPVSAMQCRMVSASHFNHKKPDFCLSHKTKYARNPRWNVNMIVVANAAGLHK